MGRLPWGCRPALMHHDVAVLLVGHWLMATTAPPPPRGRSSLPPPYLTSDTGSSLSPSVRDAPSRVQFGGLAGRVRGPRPERVPRGRVDVSGVAAPPPGIGPYQPTPSPPSLSLWILPPPQSGPDNPPGVVIEGPAPNLYVHF